MADLDAENRVLRERLRLFGAEATHNERVLRRCLDRELELLRIDGLGELLVALTDGLRTSFELSAVTLHLLDADHRLRHLLRQSGLSPLMFPRVFFLDRPEARCPAVAHLRRPRLGAFQERLHGGLFEPGSGVRSVALLPLASHDLRGSIHLGSSDAKRYTHHHASDFLDRLGVIAALCLENTVNRAQLVISGYTDPLTGLRNRRYLELRLRDELAGALRYRQPLSCLFLDADHFKHINDRFGHAAGDSALRELGGCLEAQLRASDLATRYGGEELAVVLPRTAADDAVHLAERIRTEVAYLRIPAPSGALFSLTVSIGVSTLEPDVAPPIDLDRLGRRLLAGADRALYQAKAAGRNRVRWNAPGSDQAPRDDEMPPHPGAGSRRRAAG
jgi:two-component system cell cycle response regulator